MPRKYVPLADLSGPTGAVGTWYQRAVGASDTMDTLTNGSYATSSGAVAMNLGLPNVLGSLEILTWGTGGNSGTATYLTRSTTPELLINTKIDSEWGGWKKLADLWFSESTLTVSDNLDLLPSGIRTIWSGETSQALGLPDNLMYTITTERWGLSAGIQTAKARGVTTVKVLRRQLLSGGWSVWKDISPWYDTTALTSSDNLDELTSGVRTVWSGTVAEALGLPTNTLGAVTTVRWGASAAIQTFETRALEVATYKRALLSGGWTSWQKQGGNAGGGGTSVPVSKSSGFKTVPLSLTSGNGGSGRSPISASVAYPMNWNAPITRWRMVMRDGNPRFGIGKSNRISITDLRANGVSLLSSATTPADGSFWMSPWFTGKPQGSLTFSYSAQLEPIAQVGGGTINGSASTSMPFEMWIEAEVPAYVPVIAVLGDSNSCGVGTSVPVHDSYLSVYCRRVGALPVHYSASGDSWAGWENPNQHKWTRWSHLDAVDAVLLMLGSNDMGSGTLDTAETQRRFLAVAAIAEDLISPIMHVGLLKPRNTNVGNYEVVRRLHNTWLKTKPGNVRDWHDLNSPVSSDDDNILPQYNADGTHMNTAGHQRLSDAIVKVISINGHTIASPNGTMFRLAVDNSGSLSAVAA